MTINDVSTQAITPDVWPDLTARDVGKYTDQQVPYENHATHPGLAERALRLYREAKTKCDSDTSDIRENWRWIDWLFRANSLRRTSNRDVHVPEILKAHRALVPRLVEAFFGNGQNFFATRGVDLRDRTQQNGITGLLQYQLEQNKFRMLMSPFVGSLCKYQIGVFKTTWETKVGKRWYHWVERQRDDRGIVKEVHHRELREVAIWNGNRIRLVDPARMILDAQRWAIDDMAYVGDRSDWAMHDILSYPGFANLDQVRDMIHQGHSVEMKVTPGQAARSGLRRRGDLEAENTPKNTSEFAEVGELWCWFNWAPDGAEPDMRETIITVVSDTVVVRLQENFHDDKHLPYSIARYSDNGIEFFDVGLYDPALRVQDEIDHTRGSAYESIDIQMAPRMFTKGPAIDLPNSLYDMPTGSIIKDAGEVFFQPVPNYLQALPLIDQIQRRDVEEITGVTRLWQGTEGSMVGTDQTATEVRRKIEESNRRLLGMIRSIDEAMTSLLAKMHANNQQFMTEKQRYRILNPKWAREVGRNEYEISPSELMGPVDFVFHGVTRIQQWGLRGTNLMTWMQVMGPAIQENPDKFNLAALARVSYQAIVGEDSDDEVMIEQDDMDSMSSQEAENVKLFYGQRSPIHPLDDDDKHLADMDKAGFRKFIADESIPAPIRIPAFEHYKAHVEQRQRKQAQMAALRQKASMRMAMQGQGAASQEGQAPPAGGLERGKGQTNGDGTNQQVPRAGRKAPISQANNGQ